METSFCEHYITKGDEIIESCMNDQYDSFNLCHLHLPKQYICGLSDNSAEKNERPSKMQKIINDTVNISPSENVNEQILKSDVENNQSLQGPENTTHKKKRKQCIYIGRNGCQCITGTTSEHGLCCKHKNCKLHKS